MIYFKKYKDAKKYATKYGYKTIWFDNNKQMYYVSMI